MIPFRLHLLEHWRHRQLVKWFAVVALLYLLLAAVRLLSTGFQLAWGDQAEALFTFAANPFLGLMIGILATALIQSSSTVSSIVVGLVAGGLPVAAAVPIIMGANVGTTMTNTIVSLGHLQASEEFKRAFAAATIHDCFNLCCLLLFFPLEIAFHGLEKLAKFIADILLNPEQSWNFLSFNILDLILNPFIERLTAITNPLPTQFTGIGFAVLGILLILGSIFYLSKLLKVLLVGKARKILYNAIGRNALIGMFAGTGITCLIQSSSAATSLMIPLAGNGVFRLEQIYPFTLGTNIGTCLTALLAATALTGDVALPGLEIALVHLSYNCLGILIIYGLPWLRQIPLVGAQLLAEAATRYKFATLGYILLLFFVLPGMGLAITARF